MLQKKGILYVVSTPIGNLDDISKRALTILSQVEAIFAEDTRHSQTLLRHFSIYTPLLSLNEHNEKDRSSLVIEKLLSGQNIALISDAGTPLISDPGFCIVQLAHEHGITVSPIPGACAAIAALSVAGLPCHDFTFEGFLAHKESTRQEKWQQLKQERRTLIFYEAPHRILIFFQELIAHCGADRKTALVKELTKIHETVVQGTAQQILDWLQADEKRQKGEFVIVVAGHPHTEEIKTISIDPNRVLALLLADLPLKQATQLTSKITGVNKNQLYAQALLMKGENNP